MPIEVGLLNRAETVHLVLVGASFIEKSTGRPLTRCNLALELHQLDMIPVSVRIAWSQPRIDMEPSQTDRAVQCADRGPEVPVLTCS